MTATLQTKEGRKNYFAVIDYKDENGKRKMKWINTGVDVKGDHIREANRRLREILHEYESQQISIDRDVLFTEFLKRWFETMKATNAIAPTTADAYSLVLSVHLLPYFEPKRLKVTDVTPAHIQAYIILKLKTLSGNTIRKHLANLSSCFESAVKQNIIAFNPVKRVELPRKEKYDGAKHLNEEQISKLLEVSKGDTLEIVILLTVFYGLRRSEALGLRWSALDMVLDVVKINHTVVNVAGVPYEADSTKNVASRSTLPLLPLIKERLIVWKAQQAERQALQPNDYHESDYICTDFKGDIIKPNFVSQHFDILLRKNGLPDVRFHDLRHSAAAYLHYLGFDLKDIQTWLRHSDIGTTANLYMTLDMSAKKNIADRLNEKFAALC